MNKTRIALLTAVGTLALALAGPAAADTFDFFETGITCTTRASCTTPAAPTALASLTLSGPTETGSASWSGGGPATVTDPGFSFQTALYQLDIGSPSFTICGGEQGVGCRYQIAWSETAGKLTSLYLFVWGTTDSIGDPIFGFGLAGGSVGSDGTFAGCEFGVCQVSGFWQATAASGADPVTEPSTLAVLLLSFLGIRRETGGMISPHTIKLAERAIKAAEGGK